MTVVAERLSLLRRFREKLRWREDQADAIGIGFVAISRHVNSGEDEMCSTDRGEVDSRGVSLG
jgi:hypothetical protein